MLGLLQFLFCFVFPFFCTNNDDGLCNPNPCLNGGTCELRRSFLWWLFLVNDSYECVDCNPGWTGAANCGEDVDECARAVEENSDNLCDAGQECRNIAGSYVCAVPSRARLPLLLEAINNGNDLQGTYESCSELHADLVTAAEYLANATIERNVQWYFHNNWDYGNGGGGDRWFDDGGPDPPLEGVDPEGGADNDIPTNEDSYQTNNQVDGVQEADSLKSNGVQAFVSYGQEIVEYDVASHSVVRRTALPIPEEVENDDPQDYCGGGYSNIEGMLLIGGNNPEDEDDDGFEEELVVFVREYSYYYCGPVLFGDVPAGAPSSTATDDTTTTTPIIQSQSATKVYRYRTSDMARLQNDGGPPDVLFGNYLSARAVGRVVYAVTSNWLNAQSFTRLLDPYNEEIYGPPGSFTEDEYLRTARNVLEENRQAFVDQLVSELESGVGCTSVQPLALLQNTDDALGFAPGILESFVNVHSFSLEEKTKGLSTRTTMLPSTHWNVYASKNYLVLVGEGYNVGVWLEDADAEDGDDDGESAREESYVIVFELSGASVAKVKAGSVPGYALNQFSIDQRLQWDPETNSERDFLRIATCTRWFWFWRPQREAWEPRDEPLCQVSVLDINDNMAIVGTVDDLGKAREQIFAVRFLDDRGFVVTFEQVDPLYSLNMTIPREPFAAGELEVPGFSTYLHPIDEKWILGVGQDVVDGRQVGLKISIFQVDDLSNPQERFTYVEEDPSYSAAQFEHKAFRLLPESKLLILPVVNWGSYDSGNDLDGFRVYRVDTVSDIVPYMSVEHAAGGDLRSGCWSSSWLEPRSIVVDGILHTFKGHVTAANNLSNREFIDRTNLDEDKPPEDCNYYFPFV